MGENRMGGSPSEDGTKARLEQAQPSLRLSPCTGTDAVYVDKEGWEAKLRRVGEMNWRWFMGGGGRRAVLGGVYVFEEIGRYLCYGGGDVWYILVYFGGLDIGLKGKYKT